MELNRGAIRKLEIKLATINGLIHTFRGQRVMLDADLAALYGVRTKELNQAVSRNRGRFPDDFMFQLSLEEAHSLRFQIGTSKKGRGGRRYLMNAFTEQGVAMLSSVLKSERAVEINIAIMRAFVKLRQAVLFDATLAERMDKAEQALEALETEQGEHAVAIQEVLSAFRRLTKEADPS